MISGTPRCSICKEFIFKPKNTKKELICYQCRYAKNAKRKFHGGARRASAKAYFHPTPLNKNRPCV